MPVLKNPKHEKFAQNLVEGMPASRAYIAAGYKSVGNVAEVCAMQLLRRPLVQARVSELKEAVSEVAVQRIGFTLADVIAELGKIAFVNMADFTRPAADGSIVLDFSTMTRDQAAAIGEVVIEEFMDGGGDDARQVRKTRFKLLDKKGALVDIGKHLGGFVTRTEVGKPGEFEDKSDAELRSIVEGVSGRAGARRKGSLGTGTTPPPKALRH